MSFNKTIYDTCSYKQRLAESVGEFAYVIDPIQYQHPHPSRIEFGIIAGNDVSITNNMVDVESDLFGIDRKLSRCDTLKYINPCPKSEMNVCKPKQIIMRGNPSNTGRVLDTSLYHLPPAQMFRYTPIVTDPYMLNKFQRC